MNKPLVYILTLILALLFSCSLGNRVTVEEFSPEGEIPQLTTFTIVFSEPLAPPDSQNIWLSDEFIKFEPAIQGKFKWVTDNTLIFSPDYALKPMQKYTAEITDKVLFGKDLSSDFDVYEFNTPDFDAVKADFFWTNIPNESYKLSVQGNIHFNYDVSPEQLKQFIEVFRGDEKVKDYNIVSTNPSNIIAMNFGEIKQTDKSQKLTIKILKGLKSTLGMKAMEDTREFTQELPPITKLAITGVSAGFDGSTGWIEVGTTQRVDDTKVAKFVSLKPKMDLKFFVNEGSFRIETDLTDSREFFINIKKGLPGLYGGELEFDFEQQVTMANLEPQIRFADRRGKYLMMGGLQNIEVNTVNIDEVEVVVSRIYQNNIVHFLDRYSYYYYEDDEYYWSPSYDAGNFGKELYTQTIKIQSGRNWLEKFTINLDSALKGKFNGIYTVTVRSAHDRWLDDSKMVAISDLGIISKKSKNEIFVFVNSIATTEPIEGAEVRIISTNNQTILKSITDLNGIAKFENINNEIEGFEPRLVTVEKSEDFNYMDLQETLIETSRFDVGGLYEYAEDYRTFIYSERDLYRPGETVNLSAILRNDKIERITGEPIIVKIIDPRGKTFREFREALNSEGSFEQAIDIPDYAATGIYYANLYTGSDLMIGSYKFSIEEFVPDKIRVLLKAEKDNLLPGEEIIGDIDAEFLFGAKAANMKYNVDIQMNHRSFTSSAYNDYRFGYNSVYKDYYSNDFLEGKLDDQGHASFNKMTDIGIKSPGFIEATAYVSVFDLTGRTVNRSIDFNIYPNELMIGLKASGYYHGTNDNISLKLVSVDYNDKPQNASAIATLIRYEWQTVLKKDNSNRYFYASEKKEVKIWERDLKLTGKPTDFKFSVDRSGSYEIRISEKGNDKFISYNFYAWGWASSTASSFEVEKEGQIEIVFDKKKYEPGDKAKILFNCPFSGKLLVTIERNGVFKHEYIKMEGRSTEMTVPLLESYMPNVYVTATLFKPHERDRKTPFLVGHGFASMQVEKATNNLNVAILAPDKIKPDTRQTIEIKTAPDKDIFVTLAAVDEGILQIKGYNTPDPYGFMYAKRALKVESYDLYKLLLPEIVSLSSTTGGGEGDFEMQRKKRTNPVKTKRFKLLSFWSGIKKTDRNGRVKITLDIPRFNGEVRLMAVAYSGPKFGSAEKSMKVADKIIVEPEIPRFLSTGDKLDMPVTAINTTDKQEKVTLKVKVEGPLKINGNSSGSLNIKGGATGKLDFNISAGNTPGKAKIIIEASGPVKFKEVIDIAVRPVSPLVVESGNGTIRAGKSIDLNIPGNYISSTKETILTISKFPAIKLAAHLKYLVGYPHGCIEQTTSKLFPQLYFADMAKLVAPELFRTRTPAYYVKEGIRKIESMQMYNGAMSYWQGGNYESTWGTVYATHFLIEAKKAGYPVSDDVLDKALRYIAGYVKKHETYDYYSYSNNQRTIVKIAKKEILYGLYVLAMAGKHDISTMNYYKSRPHLMSNDTKYLLGGAYALAGQWSSYYSVIPKNYSPEKTDRTSGGCFDSEIRANSIMLNVLLETDPSNKQIPYLVKHISSRAGDLYSTQERSFAFLAIGKAANKNSSADVKVKVLINGKTLETFTGNDIRITDSKLNDGRIKLEASGKGEVYYFWSVEGILSSGNVTETDSYMRIRREYYDYRTKRKISDGKFDQGQLIVCKISLTGMNRSAENIAITDMIPAGFEIENPRLNTSTDLKWDIKNDLYYQYMDVRDDRMMLFSGLSGNTTREYIYMLRVVNKGEFNLPVISGEAMYDPEFHSRNGAGKVHVR